MAREPTREELIEELERLRTERLFLERVLDHVPNMIFVKEAGELRFVRFNRAGEDLLGFQREDLIGKNDFDFFPEEEAKFFVDKDREVLAGTTVLDIPEEPIHTANGERWLHTQKVPIRGEHGQPLYLLGISEDITERRNAAAELARSQERLAAEKLEARLLQAQKLESLGVLAGGVAHDFNNLLVGILGNASLALAELEAAHPANRAVQMVEKSARMASELTRQLLAYSGQGRYVVERLVLSELVREMAALLEVTVARRATLRLELADEGVVEADALQMRQLLLNLLTNAAEATEGVDTAVVTVSSAVVDADAAYLDQLDLALELRQGTYVVLEVSDNGCGMDSDTRRRMFDPFFTTKERGHGLGLAAALGIVRGHGGGVRVYSEPGRGTTIKVLLPCVQAEAGTFPLQREAPRDLSGCRVLVVDDHEVVRDFACRALRAAGADVMAAADGAEALGRYEDSVDVVVLDMSMPGLSGPEVFAELRALDPEVRVVLSSGYSELEATRRFEGNGLAGFLPKPYTISELIESVKAAGSD